MTNPKNTPKLIIDPDIPMNIIDLANQKQSYAVADEQDAAFIVKAVNNHENLRDALLVFMVKEENSQAYPEFIDLLKASE